MFMIIIMLITSFYQVPLILMIKNNAGGTDFDDGNITLNFNTSSSSRVCFDPRIIEDSMYEGDEQFLLTFGNLPSDEANVGPIEQACITIVDDDSKRLNC